MNGYLIVATGAFGAVVWAMWLLLQNRTLRHNRDKWKESSDDWRTKYTASKSALLRLSRVQEALEDENERVQEDTFERLGIDDIRHRIGRLHEAAAFSIAPPDIGRATGEETSDIPDRVRGNGVSS